MTQELYKLFVDNFPYIIREEKTAKSILQEQSNKVIEKRDVNGNLIGAVVINKNTILLLCVNKEHRNKGIGNELLIEAEKYISSQGYNEINIGVGFDYLMPGVPTNEKVLDEPLEKDNVYDSVDDIAYHFFKKRGYYHSWEDANCFDMCQDLKDFDKHEHKIGDTIDGITYVWATEKDLENIIKCTEDACDDFTKYYKDMSLYEKNSNKRVLLAKDKDQVVGTLMVLIETEAIGVGSVGCTTVKHSYRGKHIGVNLTILGTSYLKEKGLPKAYLGYTYTGLDRMYGYAGYKICVYYFMAKKNI